MPVILDPHFYEILLPDPPLAFERLRVKLNSFDLLSDLGWEAQTLLLPMANGKTQSTLDLNLHRL